MMMDQCTHYLSSVTPSQENEDLSTTSEKYEVSLTHFPLEITTKMEESLISPNDNRELSAADKSRNLHRHIARYSKKNFPDHDYPAADPRAIVRRKNDRLWETRRGNIPEMPFRNELPALHTTPLLTCCTAHRSSPHAYVVELEPATLHDLNEAHLFHRGPRGPSQRNLYVFQKLPFKLKFIRCLTAEQLTGLERFSPDTVPTWPVPKCVKVPYEFNMVPFECNPPECREVEWCNYFCCTEQGFFEDVKDCRKYFFCDRDDIGFRMYHITCRPGYIFNPSFRQCIPRCKNARMRAASSFERNGRASRRRLKNDDEDGYDSAKSTPSARENEASSYLISKLKGDTDPWPDYDDEFQLRTDTTRIVHKNSSDSGSLKPKRKMKRKFFDYADLNTRYHKKMKQYKKAENTTKKCTFPKKDFDLDGADNDWNFPQNQLTLPVPNAIAIFEHCRNVNKSNYPFCKLALAPIPTESGEDNLCQKKSTCSTTSSTCTTPATSTTTTCSTPSTTTASTTSTTCSTKATTITCAKTTSTCATTKSTTTESACQPTKCSTAATTTCYESTEVNYPEQNEYPDYADYEFQDRDDSDKGGKREATPAEALNASNASYAQALQEQKSNVTEDDAPFVSPTMEPNDNGTLETLINSVTYSEQKTTPQLNDNQEDQNNAEQASTNVGYTETRITSSVLYTTTGLPEIESKNYLANNVTSQNREAFKIKADGPLPEFEKSYKEKKSKNYDGYPCKEYGRYPDTYDRSSYYECSAQPDGNMKIEHRRCPKDEEFSPEFLECVGIGFLKATHRKRRVTPKKPTKGTDCDDTDEEEKSPNEWLDASHGSKVPSEFQKKTKQKLRIYHLHCKRNSGRKKERRDGNLRKDIRIDPQSVVPQVGHHRVRSYEIKETKKDEISNRGESNDESGDDDDDDEDDEDYEYDDGVGQSEEKDDQKSADPQARDQKSRETLQNDSADAYGDGTSELKSFKDSTTEHKILLDANIHVDKALGSALKSILGKRNDEQMTGKREGNERNIRRKDKDKDSILIRLLGEKAGTRSKRSFMQDMLTKASKGSEESEKEGAVNMLTLLNGLPSEYERDMLLQKLERRKMLGTQLENAKEHARKRKRKEATSHRRAKKKDANKIGLGRVQRGHVHNPTGHE